MSNNYQQLRTKVSNMSTRSRGSIEKSEAIPVTERLSSDDGGDAAGGFCAVILTIFSVLFIIFFCIRIVQEYERAVIFRLGRIKKGGAVGPGLFFIIPCMDDIRVVDLRTISFDVPPQEIL